MCPILWGQMQSLICDRKLETDPCIQAASCECIWDERQNPSYHSKIASVTQIHIQQSPCSDSHTLWQPVQFTRTVDRTTGCEMDTRQCVRACVFVCVCGWVCVCVCAYMQPQQSLLLHRRWVARESAADEAKHFFHGEGQRAQLNIKHLTVSRRHNRI